MDKIPQFVIGAVASGSGKTTLSLGLMRFFSREGTIVQPFKLGPDYIDTQFHRVAAGVPSYNLDFFFASTDHLRDLYARCVAEAGVAVVEGAMGLFDGYSGLQGSAAQLAIVLDLPIILIMNAKAMAYTVAPILYGLTHLAPAPRVVGVVFNHVRGESHYRFLADAARDVGVEPLGFLPPNPQIAIPSRHLGLDTDSLQDQTQRIDQLADFIVQHIDTDRIKVLTMMPRPVPQPVNFSLTRSASSRLRVAMAYDSAFCFVYQEMVDYLRGLGSFVTFSPLRDASLPPCDFLYLPGGYPEEYLGSLSSNVSLRASVKAYIEGGGRALAECGGMMYLSEAIEDVDGHCFPMVGIFAQQCTMRGCRLSLGYRQCEYNGIRVKGHEFHYSRVADSSLASETQFLNAAGQPVPTKLLRYKRAIASYVHIYWPGQGDLLQLFK